MRVMVRTAPATRAKNLVTTPTSGSMSRTTWLWENVKMLVLDLPCVNAEKTKAQSGVITQIGPVNTSGY